MALVTSSFRLFFCHFALVFFISASFLTMTTTKITMMSDFVVVKSKKRFDILIEL